MGRAHRLLAAVLAVVLVSGAVHAARGQKSRSCPRWEARLAALEQAGVPADTSPTGAS